jgi:hypothetical protein
VVSTILLMVVVMAVATRASDAMKLRQEEAILRKLPIAEAHDYYQVLRRRARRVQVMRAVTLAGLLLALLAGRRRLMQPRAPGRGIAGQVAHTAPTNTDAAKALAEQELARQAARGQVDPTRLRLRGISGDDRHPWIFDYEPIAPAAATETPTGSAGAFTDRVRIYIDRAGGAELHRLP